MNNAYTGYTVPSGWDFINDNGTGTGGFVYNTPASTSLYITTNYSTLPVSTPTVTVRKHAQRLPKKAKGDTTDANSKRLRISNLIKPIVAFSYIKKNFKANEIKKLDVRLEKIAKILESTAVTNQIALKDKIEEKFGKLLREQEMISCGFDKFLEKGIIQAYIDSVKDKAIKITPIKNYVRLIPKDVRERMDVARGKKLFDDFIVIHCDPENKAVEKTREEKKDPILCGVIKESPLYYFVGDWTDELCDLSMDQIMEYFDLTKNDVTLPDVESAMLEIL